MPVLNAMQPMSEYGRKIVKNGYQIIPITPGTKLPSIKNWPNADTSLKSVTNWASNGKAQCGISILTEFTAVVDIDVLNEEVSINIMEVVQERLGRGLSRTGMVPKVGLLYQVLEPFSKVSSPVYVSPNGDKHKVEILGKGQHCVCIGVHPDTGKPYRFNGARTIVNTPLKDLPIMTEEDAYAIVEAFCEMIPSDWELHSPIKGNRVHREPVDPDMEGMDCLEHPVDEPLETIVEYMGCVDPIVSHDDWVVKGMALWHQFDGSEEGFEIWHNWSQLDVDGYSRTSRGKMKAKWKTFDWRRRQGKPITFRTVIKEVNEGETEGESKSKMDYYLDRYALLPNDRIADLYGHGRSQKNYGGLSAKYIANDNPDDFYRPKFAKKDKPLIDKWLRHKHKKLVAGFEYSIGDPVMFHADDANWVNTYIPPKFAETEDESLLQPFFDHMKYMFPNKHDRELFYQWMGHRVQRPHERIKFVPLHIVKRQGSGRGWLNDLLRHMVGVNNAQETTIEELQGKGQGAFNTFLNSAICTLHEVKGAAKRYAVDDKIRSTLEADFLKVTAKGQTAIMKRISCSFLMFSNNYDALALTEEDRRMWVIRGPDYLKPTEWYDRLYDLIESSEFLMQVYNFLKRVDLSGFKRGQRAPDHSGMRRELIVNSASTDDLVTETILEDLPFRVATLMQIERWADCVLPEDIPNRNSLSKALESQGAKKYGRIRWGKNSNVFPIVLDKDFKPERTDKGRRMVKKELELTEEYLSKLEQGVDQDELDLI